MYTCIHTKKHMKYTCTVYMYMYMYILSLVMSFQPVGMEMGLSLWRGIQLFVITAALPIEAKTTMCVNKT